MASIAPDRRLWLLRAAGAISAALWGSIAFAQEARIYDLPCGSPSTQTPDEARHVLPQHDFASTGRFKPSKTRRFLGRLVHHVSMGRIAFGRAQHAAHHLGKLPLPFDNGVRVAPSGQRRGVAQVIAYASEGHAAPQQHGRHGVT